MLAIHTVLGACIHSEHAPTHLPAVICATTTTRTACNAQAAEAGGKLRQVCEPVGAAAASAFKPLRNALPSVRPQPGYGNEGNSLNELARQLKVKMSG